MINSPIDEIKSRLDIVEVIKGYIKIDKAGANYRSVCPFHGEKSPSFFISSVKQIWHCFGSCSEGGDMFKFVMKIEGIEFGDALRILAQKAGIELKPQSREMIQLKTEKSRLYDIANLASTFFETQLWQSEMGNKAKDYLLARKMTEKSMKEWKIGYAPDTWQGLSSFLSNRGYSDSEIERVGLILKSSKERYYDRFRGRIIFPIFDLTSSVVGFGGRIFKQTKRYDGADEAKYINSPSTVLYDKSRMLYGLHKSGIEIRKNDRCVLTEGYMDVIMSYQAGVENVVSTSGTALTVYQLKILKRYTDNLHTAFDMDLAGSSATKRGIDLAQEEGFNIKIVSLPEGKDPADVASEDPEKLISLIDQAKSIHDFYFETTLSLYDKNTIDGKRDISKILLPVISKIPNKIEQSVWIQRMASELSVGETDVMEELNKIKVEPTDTVIQKEDKKVESRKELLEEKIVLLIIKDSKNVSFLTREDLKLFSLANIDILDHLLKNNGKTDGISKDYKDRVNYLSLKSELDISDDLEFKRCLSELRRLVLRDKLTSISKSIKEAERNNNDNKIQELTKQFNQYSKSFTNN